MKKRMLEKTAIDLKLSAQVSFTMLYFGARQISKHVTKATLMSMCVNSACTGIPAVLYDVTLKPYTFGDLMSLGEKSVRSAFLNLIDEKDDGIFLKRMNDCGITPGEVPVGANRDKLYRPLGMKILKNYYGLVNLRETDFENMISVIFVSEEDLQDANEIPLGSYMFLKAAEPYTCYKEMDKIIFRYMRLCSETNE
jgi:hypothetical protein